MTKKNKKTRNPIIIPHFDSHVVISGLREENGIFKFLDDKENELIPSVVYVGTSYQKLSGRQKILNQIRTKNKDINLNHSENLLNYDWLFVVDTNTHDYKSDRISVSCSAYFIISFEEIKQIGNTFQQIWNAKTKLRNAFIFKNAVVNPERVAWQELINSIKLIEGYTTSTKVGIVVDSELGDLREINDQKKPVIGDHLLPQNFDLIYASSDLGMDYPQNKLMKICDQNARSVWKHLQKNSDKINGIKDIENMFIEGYTTLPLDSI